MQTHPQPRGRGDLSRLADASCLASARTWRREAEALRDHAAARGLTQQQRTTLLREADAAERQSDWWLDALERI